MPINFDKAFGVHDDALLLFERRTRLLAENIANADTPQYKARDIDFDSALRQVQTDQVNLAVTQPGHMALSTEPYSEHLKFRVPDQSSADGNTVDMQKEQAAFAENNIRYQTTLTILSRRISGLVSAFKGE
ncbi:MAG: flagellar basal body rod protein FlgB [Gammaproteobacteria bacterium]